MLSQKPEPILLAKIFHNLTTLGRIHPVAASVQGS
jgi:hypothetical protein